MANRNLTAAKNAKNDEFYTRLEDIQKELYNYPNAFVDKIVYLNCDDGEWSNFWKYFYQRFHSLKLKKLIATSYKKEGDTYKYEFEGDGSNYETYMEGVIKTSLTGNGDFRSEECLAILEEADVVVTNPPFSLFREFIATLMKYEKKFLVICNLNCVTYKEIFPFIKNNKMWPGFSFNKVMEFIMPDYYELKGKAYIDDLGRKHGFVPAICWMTNIEHNKRHNIEKYYSEYFEDKYPKYDNYDAIEISRSVDIPCNYTGTMGVPITWLDKYCSDQFDIVGLFASSAETNLDEGIIAGKETECISKNGTVLTHGPTINKVAKYARILIKWKPEAMPILDENGVPVYR